MLSTYVFSGALIKVLGFLFILLSDYFLTEELFVEQQSIFRYIIGISAIMTIGSDVAYRRYLHKQSFYMSFLMPFFIIIVLMVILLISFNVVVDLLNVTVLLLAASLLFKLNDFLKAELEYLRDRLRIIIFDAISGPLVRYSVLILFLLTGKTFEFLLIICFFVTFGIGIFLVVDKHRITYSFESKLSTQISKLALSYMPNRIQIFLFEFLAVGAIVSSYSSEISRIYFIALSYGAVLQMLSQSANRWYFRDRVDFDEDIFKKFKKSRIYSILGMYLLYVGFLPIYLKMFSLDIFNSAVFNISVLLIVNNTISFVQKFFMAELVVIERVWLPNILISLTTMIPPLALLNIDLKIDDYLFLLVCTTFLSTLIAYTTLRITKKTITEN